MIFFGQMSGLLHGGERRPLPCLNFSPKI